jgi:mannose-1-phosphate guanylyltransferase/mannose-6-phosphate isomerase
MSQLIVPVILSGGSGQRLWPLSREMHPKQFINILTDRSLLQETAMRLGGPQFSPPMVVCNDSHRFIVAEQLREAGIQPGPIVLEPCRRNTAPAAALAALILLRDDANAIMLLAPSDHAIGKPEAFATAISIGLKAAVRGKLVTFGVVPDHPATGYGYVRKGARLTAQMDVLLSTALPTSPPSQQRKNTSLMEIISGTAEFFYFPQQSSSKP